MSDTNNDTSTQAAKIVRKHMYGSIASGVLPIPLLDIGILTAIQLRMVRSLAKLYEIDFAEQRAKAIISSFAGLGLVATAGGVLRMILPGAARALFGIGSLALPPAATYAVGQLFIKHFESGGTIWTFDETKAKDDYEEELETGKKVVEQNFAGVKP